MPWFVVQRQTKQLVLFHNVKQMSLLWWSVINLNTVNCDLWFLTNTSNIKGLWQFYLLYRSIWIWPILHCPWSDPDFDLVVNYLPTKSKDARPISSHDTVDHQRVIFSSGKSIHTNNAHFIVPSPNLFSGEIIKYLFLISFMSKHNLKSKPDSPNCWVRYNLGYCTKRTKQNSLTPSPFFPLRETNSTTKIKWDEIIHIPESTMVIYSVNHTFCELLIVYTEVNYYIDFNFIHLVYTVHSKAT